MASRKKQSTSDPELIEDDIEIDAKPIKGPARQVTETKTTKYIEPIAEPEEEDDGFDFENRPARRKSKTGKEERDSLKADLAKASILPASNLRVHFWKFKEENSELGGGVADKAFCEKFYTTKDQLVAGHHLDIAKRYGPGRYWFMTYLDNKLVTSWEESIAAAPQFGQTMQMQNGQQQIISAPDPANPNVTIQMPAGQSQPYVDPLKQMRESFKMMKEMREAMGIIEPQQPQQPQLSPELQMAGFMLQDADLKKKAIKSLFGSNGESGEKDLLTTAIENIEPIGKAIEGIIRQIFSNVQDLKGGNNGQAQNHQSQFIAGTSIAGNSEANQIPLTDSGYSYRDAGRNDKQIAESGQVQISPEDELFSRVLNFCKRKTPVKIAADQIISFANTVEENPAAMVPGYGLVRQYPIGSSVWAYIEMFVGMPVDGALAFVANTEGGKEIVELEWSKAWCESLQAELKPAIEQGGENGA